MTIQRWLESDRDYATGLQLLKQNGGRNSLLTILAKETTYNRNRLARELLKIANRVPVAAPKAPKPQSAKKSSAVKPTISAVDWPKELHPAVERLQKLYQLVNHNHPLLDHFYNISRKKAFDIKNLIVDCWQEIEEIWRILNYYRDHKVILPNKYNPDERHLPYDRARLMKRRFNLRTYISRDTKNPAKADKVKEWRKELQAIEKKLADAV